MSEPSSDPPHTPTRTEAEPASTAFERSPHNTFAVPSTPVGKPKARIGDFEGEGGAPVTPVSEMVRKIEARTSGVSPSPYYSPYGSSSSAQQRQQATPVTPDPPSPFSPPPLAGLRMGADGRASLVVTDAAAPPPAGEAEARMATSGSSSGAVPVSAATASSAASDLDRRIQEKVRAVGVPGQPPPLTPNRAPPGSPVPPTGDDDGAKKTAALSGTADESLSFPVAPGTSSRAVPVMRSDSSASDLDRRIQEKVRAAGVVGAATLAPTRSSPRPPPASLEAGSDQDDSKLPSAPVTPGAVSVSAGSDGRVRSKIAADAAPEMAGATPRTPVTPGAYPASAVAGTGSSSSRFALESASSASDLDRRIQEKVRSSGVTPALTPTRTPKKPAAARHAAAAGSSQDDESTSVFWPPPSPAPVPPGAVSVTGGSAASADARIRAKLAAAPEIPGAAATSSPMPGAHSVSGDDRRVRAKAGMGAAAAAAAAAIPETAGATSSPMPGAYSASSGDDRRVRAKARGGAAGAATPTLTPPRPPPGDRAIKGGDDDEGLSLPPPPPPPGPAPVTPTPGAVPVSGPNTDARVRSKLHAAAPQTPEMAGASCAASSPRPGARPVSADDAGAARLRYKSAGGGGAAAAAAAGATTAAESSKPGAYQGAGRTPPRAAIKQSGRPAPPAALTSSTSATLYGAPTTTTTHTTTAAVSADQAGGAPSVVHSLDDRIQNKVARASVHYAAPRQHQQHLDDDDESSELTPGAVAVAAAGAAGAGAGAGGAGGPSTPARKGQLSPKGGRSPHRTPRAATAEERWRQKVEAASGAGGAQAQSAEEDPRESVIREKLAEGASRGPLRGSAAPEDRWRRKVAASEGLSGVEAGHEVGGHHRRTRSPEEAMAEKLSQGELPPLTASQRKKSAEAGIGIVDKGLMFPVLSQDRDADVAGGKIRGEIGYDEDDPAQGGHRHRLSGDAKIRAEVGEDEDLGGSGHRGRLGSSGHGGGGARIAAEIGEEEESIYLRNSGHGPSSGDIDDLERGDPPIGRGVAGGGGGGGGDGFLDEDLLSPLPRDEQPETFVAQLAPVEERDHAVSAMAVKVVDEKEDLMEEEKRTGRKLTRRDKRKLGAAGFVVLVGLGVGLGVGLSRKPPPPGPACVHRSPWRKVGESIARNESTASKHSLEGTVSELYDAFGSDVTVSDDGARVAAVDRYGDNVTVHEYDAESNQWVLVGTPILSEEPFITFNNSDKKEFYEATAASIISGNGQRVAVTVPMHNTPNISRSGRVRVYEYSSTLDGNGNDIGDWTQVGSDILGTYEGAYLGRQLTVDLSHDGRTLAVGDYRRDRWKGCVTVYRMEEGSDVWTPRGDDICGAETNQRTGGSVSLSSDGDAVAVGFQGLDRGVGGAAVYRYAEDSGVWTLVGGNIRPWEGYCHFGWPVSLSGDGTRVAVSGSSYFGEAPNCLDLTNYPKQNAGEVRVYELREEAGGGKNWTQMGPGLVGTNETDGFGWSVSLSGDGATVGMGASNSDQVHKDAGYATAYRYECGEWSQVGSPMRGKEPSDWTGFAIDLSYDGTRFAVGSPNDFGVPDEESGVVDVYHHEY